MRLIAKLDVKPPYVVKPVHFEGLRKMGSPDSLIKKYYDDAADEIFYIDIVSSLYQRKFLIDEFSEAAKGLFIPLAIGGGIKSIDDMSAVLHSGADKVAINTAAISNPYLIDEAAKVFGSQAIVVNVEAKYFDKKWVCFTQCGRIRSNKNVFDWVNELQDRGAGEILIQSVDNDGRQRGFALEMLGEVKNISKIPMVAASGAGTLEDIISLANEIKPDAIALASVLHYNKLTITQIKQELGL